jgi:hypothetical protein
MLNTKPRRIGFATLALVLGCIAMGGAVHAAPSYDGNWTVLIATRSGACAQAYRYGVRISAGSVIYEGGMVALHGSVTPKGAVRVTVRAGGQWASGSGRLSGNHGGGIWKGQGTDGACAGTWSAERQHS